MVFSMELLAISIMSEAGSKHKVCFGALLGLSKGFSAVKSSRNKIESRKEKLYKRI